MCCGICRCNAAGCEAANELELELTCPVNVSAVLPAPPPFPNAGSILAQGLLSPAALLLLVGVSEPFPALCVPRSRGGSKDIGDAGDQWGSISSQGGDDTRTSAGRNGPGD